MSNYNMITIKNKLSGFSRTIGEPEFNGMIDKADYDVVATEKPTSSNPDETWTKAEIKSYLDGKDISYTAKDSKSTLLSKIGT